MYGAPELGIAEEVFDSMGVTVTLDLVSTLSDVRPYSVSVRVAPPDSVTVITTNITHAELTDPIT